MHRLRIGVLTSGADCPGSNAVLRATVASAHTLGWEVLGFIGGYEGLLFPINYMPLTLENTEGITATGGTIIGTTNKGHFGATSESGEKVQIPQRILDAAKKTVLDLGLHALICIGGDNTLRAADQLFASGVPVIGVPKTIDNDLSATAWTFGFDSAVQCVVDALDRLRTTAASHKRVMVLEVMGRHSGWIALYGGFAGGADVILIPEIPFSYEHLCAHVAKRMSGGADSTLIVVAEGAAPKGGEVLTVQSTTHGEIRLGGIGARVAQEIMERTGHETRTVVLGHLQRGGAPTTQDRILGIRFGVGAVQLIQEKKFGNMVSYLNYEIGSVPIKEAIGRIKHVPPEGQIVKTAQAVGISFGV
ncbi:MAG: ATP-dependent 6-phosphofructokinase [Methylacidiphilales bacterium]|nr:ATP-dependent 6-phosphofructokinase [Candidatus Methylacidiphilales bacterium]